MRKHKTTYTLRQGLRLNLRAIRLWNTILPHYWLWSISLCLAENFSPYFGLYMSARLINELAGACDRARLLGLAAVTVGGNFALALAKKWLANRRDVLEHASWRAHEAHVMGRQNTFPYSLLEDPQTALLRTRIYEDMEATGLGMPHVKDAINNLFGAGINILFSISLTVSLFMTGCDSAASGGMGGLLGFLHTPLASALVLAVIVGGAVVSLRLVGIRTQKVSDAANGLAESNIRWRAFDRLRGPDMYLFGLYRFVEEDFRRTQLRPPWLFQAEKYIIRYDGLSLLAAAASGLAVFLLTAAKALSGVIGIGNFVLYQGAVSRFTGALGQLSIWVGRLWYNLPYLERLYSYLDQPNQMYQGSLAVEKRDDLDYEIEFCDVSFRYPRTENWVLRHVNIRFKIGDKLAIVGENGSGKTTFIKLLCRLYDPTEGQILLNGIDITRYRYGEYMDLFSVVFQDFSLFDFPLGELVAADPDYDPDRVRDCLTRAGFGEKLAALDADPPAGRPTLDLPLGKGYDTEGIELSGGERQKVALARALYKDAPFVILDEPTAALDPIAEAAVYENFNRLVREKTAVFISHRLSSCRFCDAIAVFDHGQLVQLGAHDTLLADPTGKYSQLWRAQAKYYS